MKPEYATWIDGWVRTRSASVHVVGLDDRPIEERIPWAIRGSCHAAVEDMVVAFPELRVVRGYYGGCSHWWCETPDGEVVDPTAAQFEPGDSYVEYDGPDPLGKCMNCGSYVWTGGFSGFCSSECLAAIAAEGW